jgi:hypothetical protein
MAKKKATLYVAAPLNGGWLLITIDTALWLYKSDGFEEVTICCVSNYNPFNFFSLLLRLKNFHSYINKNKSKELINFTKFSNSKKDKNSELANFAVGKSDRAYLIIGNLKIQFVRLKLIKKNFLLNFITLSYRVIVDYLYYFRNSALKRKAYLKYQVANVYAGLHVLSEALRSDYKSYGSIFHCRLGIFTALYKLHSFVKEYKQIVLPKESISFVAGPAQNYVYGFFSRFISKRGAFFIETSSRQQPFIKCELKEKHYSQLKIYQIRDNVIRAKKKKIFDYYKSRIETPWVAWDYMKFHKEKLRSNKNKINIKGISVILYLHSFTDAQYVYGYDGYNDLMDWTISSISLLNSNKHISKVIIKPHPGINHVYYPGEIIAHKYLRSRLLGFGKIQWADFHFHVKNINSSGLVIGITHHGSIAEELVFNKIPVIGSTYSPWGNKYKFGYWWNNPKEYEALISTKSITELVVTKNQTDELYRYAMDLYFSVNPDNNFDIDSSWRDMLKIYGIENCHEHNANMQRIMHLISQLDPEEKKFKTYIAKRLQRISSLKYVSNKIIVKLK